MRAPEIDQFPAMELAKSYEPADIESRWYPEWEARGYFGAGLDTAKAEAFCILLPPPNVTGTVSYTHLDVYKRQAPFS